MQNFSKFICENLNGCEDCKVFVVVKPGFLNKSQAIIKRFKNDGWEVDRMVTKQLLLSEAKKLYKIHKEQDFYKDLCKYMSSSCCMAMILKNTCSNIHNEDPFKNVAKIKDEIRKEYGESDMRNVLHSSDSEEAMTNEYPIFFRCI